MQAPTCRMKLLIRFRPPIYKDRLREAAPFDYSILNIR